MTPTPRTVPFLDDRTAMTKLDTSNAFGSIEMLGSQVQQIWNLAKKLEFPREYRHVKNVVVAGMGGSALGAHAIQTIFKDVLKVPIVIAPDYTVPNYVNSETLVIASSYSGTTEETLAAVADAHQKGAKIAGITSGGKLATFLQQHSYPALVFTPDFNPCQQPRMALGYSIFGQMVLFAQAGVLNIGEQDYQDVLQTIADAHLAYGIGVTQEQNAAKILAFEMKERLPIITVAEHLEGMGHIFANQLNENAKTYSEYRVIPELNHHLMEGLRFPTTNEHNLLFLMVDSALYTQQNRKRLTLTGQVLTKNHVEFREFTAEGKSKLTSAFHLMVFGAYTNLYLAMLNALDPSPIPWVDWFKKELAK